MVSPLHLDLDHIVMHFMQPVGGCSVVSLTYEKYSNCSVHLCTKHVMGEYCILVASDKIMLLICDSVTVLDSSKTLLIYRICEAATHVATQLTNI